MRKKFAMSALGYAIVLVIILGVVMIISAPMMADKLKDKSPNDREENVSDDYRENRSEPQEYYNNSSSRPVKSSGGNESDYLYEEVRNIERRMSVRIDNIDNKLRDLQNSSSNSVSDKYVCTIEGSLDANNNVVPLDAQSSSDIKTQKFVFVCEYRE